MERFREIFSVLVFPVTLAASLETCFWLVGRGLPPSVAIAPAFLWAYLLVLALERVLPYRREWLHSRGDLPVDAAFSLSAGATQGVLTPLLLVLGASAGARLSAAIGLGLWPHALPLVPQIALALVVAELPKYWLHRLAHGWDPLWRFHAIHHSAPRLYWLNAGRFHPVDFALDHIAGVGTLAVLGCGPLVLACFFLVSVVHGVFQHANLPLRLGFLNHFFSMAELHRWHHSRTLREANTNFGQNLIVWDTVFGTRYLPQDREPPEEIGIAGLPGFPTGFWEQLVAPFRWRRVVREASGG